jgi:hypothetical protein
MNVSIFSFPSNVTTCQTSEVGTPMRRGYVVPMRWMVIYEYEVPGGALNLILLTTQTISVLYNGYRVFPGGKAAGAWS